MKRILILLLCCSLFSCSDTPMQSGAVYGTATDVQGYHDSNTEVAEQTVYVCEGNYAYAYHRSNYCAGLNNCKAMIVPVSLYEANERRRRACKRCH